MFHLDIADVPAVDQPKVIFVLEEIAYRTGVRFRIHRGLSDGVRKLSELTVYDPRFYLPSPELGAGRHHDDFRDGAPLDLIGYGFRLLTLLDEMLIPTERRMADGNIDPAVLHETRRQSIAAPLFDRLADRFAALCGRDVVRPVWPGGKTMVLCVTHDTDMVKLGQAEEIVYNAAKAALRRSRPHYDMMREGVAELLLGRRSAVDGFRHWHETLGPLGIPSTHYLSVRRRVRGHLNDVRSRVDNVQTDWAALAALADQGCEFGYHPSIHAKDDLYEFVESKDYIQHRIGRPIFGLRHHYWALDWTAPYKTFRKHVNAGFRYDATMAWRNAYGFRTGTTLPHRAFDAVRNRPLELYLLPTAIMDGYVLQSPARTEDFPVLAAAVRHCEAACRAHGGVLTVDWHTETASPVPIYTNFGTYLAQALGVLATASDVWLATPWQVISHCHEARRSLVEVV